jgi:hypothetical protein
MSQEEKGAWENLREQDGPAEMPGLYPYRRTYVSVSIASEDFAGEAAVLGTKTHEQGDGWGRQRRSGLPSWHVGGPIARDLRRETQPDTTAWGINSADAESFWDAMADSVLERKTERKTEREACEQPTSAKHDQCQALNVVQGVFSLDEVENEMMTSARARSAHQQDGWTQGWRLDASDVKVWSLQALEQQMFREARRAPPAKKGGGCSASDTARTSTGAPASMVLTSNTCQRERLPPLEQCNGVRNATEAQGMIAPDQASLLAPRVAEARSREARVLSPSAHAGARAGRWTKSGDCREGDTAGNHRPPVTTPVVSRATVGMPRGLMQSSDAGAPKPAQQGKFGGAPLLPAALPPCASMPAAAPAGGAGASLASVAVGANFKAASAGIHVYPSNAARLARNATASPSNPWGASRRASIPCTRTEPKRGHGGIPAPLAATALQPHVVSQCDETQEDSDNFPSLEAACKPTGLEAGLLLPKHGPPHVHPRVTRHVAVGVRAFGKQRQHREAEGALSGGQQHDLLATERREELPRRGGRWAQVASAEASGDGRREVR